MSNGWSGGQYSLLRAAVGIALVVHFAPLASAWGMAGVLAAVPFALGFRASLASVALVLLAATPLLSGALLLLALVPGAPYGSLDARGRLDPRGGWVFPDWIPWVARLGLLPLYAYLVYTERVTDLLGIALLHALAFDPGWIPRVRDTAPARLFYDGACGLCHHSVRFLLAEDRAGDAFRFAPLESEVFRELVPEALRRTLPDSLVLLLPDGTLATRSRAVIACAERLGGLWRVLALAASVVPEAWLDRGYDFVARMRHRWFARPSEACPLLPPELRARFDP